MVSFLPHEIIIEILSCLPVKSLIRFKCVCNDWFDLIKNPSFAKIHLQRATENGNFNLMSNDEGHVYSIDNNDVVSTPEDEVDRIEYHKTKFWGTPCNGLFCLSFKIIPDPKTHSSHNITCLWNPATQECLELPYDKRQDDGFPTETTYGFELQNDGVPTETTYGFGYDYKTDDYKVVKIDYYHKVNSCHLIVVKVYTLGSNSWRRIGDIPYVLVALGTPGIYVSGALHWVALRGEDTSEEFLFSLDIGDEEYQEVPQPDYSNTNFIMNVDVLEGCLCVTRTNYYSNQFPHIDLWMMKEYGVKESWNKLLTITQSMGLRKLAIGKLTPIKILKNGKILLNSFGLWLYDPTNPRLIRPEIQGNMDCLPWFDIVSYVDSLISLKSDKESTVGKTVQQQYHRSRMHDPPAEGLKSWLRVLKTLLKLSV